MPKNQVSDLITDQEITFVHLVLSGTMTDRQAAEAAGLNPDTAAYTKAKPRVRAYENPSTYCNRSKRTKNARILSNFTKTGGLMPP